MQWGWLTHWLVHWLIHWLIVNEVCGQSVGYLVSYLVGWSIYCDRFFYITRNHIVRDKLEAENQEKADTIAELIEARLSLRVCLLGCLLD